MIAFLHYEFAQYIKEILPDKTIEFHEGFYELSYGSLRIPKDKRPTEEDFNKAFDKCIQEHPEIPIFFLRSERDRRLKETDVYALPDYPHESDDIRQAWLDYRTSLRDITKTAEPRLELPIVEIENTPELTNVQWPTPPS